MNCIRGIEKVIYSKSIDTGVILIEGDTGVLKTTFAVAEVLKQLEESPSDVCLYLNLKESDDFFSKNPRLNRLVKEKRLNLVNFDRLMESIKSENRSNILADISGLVQDYRRTYGERFKLFIIDPINVIEPLVDKTEIRRVLFHFFGKLAEMNILSFIITESKAHYDAGAVYPYHFLADGIIQLGMHDTPDDVLRYMEIRKMRGVNHSLDRFQLSFKDGELRVLGAIYGA